MAPKGAKRATTASKEEPEAKRVAAFLKHHGITKSTHEALREIVQHPRAGLPADCREMLLAMLPWSLSIPSDLRGDAHREVVKMVEDVAEGLQVSLRAAVQAESAALGELEERQAEFHEGVQSAEAARAEAVAACDARKRELAEASAALLRQRNALGEAERKEKKDATEAERAQIEKQAVESVMTGSFHRLKMGEWQPGEEGDLFQPVQALLVKLHLDESLVTSLPVSLKKQDRGAFDQVVVNKFEEVLREQLGMLIDLIGSMESNAVVNRTVLAEAKLALESAQTKQQEAAVQLAAAQSISTDAAAKLKEAEAAMLAFEPEHAAATATRDAKMEELKSFETYQLCILKIVVDKVSKKREAELAQGSAAAEPKTAEVVQASASAEKEEAATTQASVDASQNAALDLGV